MADSAGRIRRMRSLGGLLATAVVALALAACGGASSQSASGADSAAAIVPASTPVYVSIDADRDSTQWHRLDDLLARFPGRAAVLDAVHRMLADHGLTAADLDRGFGPTVELVWLDLGNSGRDVVGLTKPDDEAALRQLFREDKLAFGDVEGWTAFAEDEATLARFRQATAGDEQKLADDPRFQRAMGGLPDEALVKAYANGERLSGELADLSRQLGAVAPQLQAQGKLDALAAAVAAEDDGLRVDYRATGAGSAVAAPHVGDLLADVPDDVIAFAQSALGRQGASLRSQLQGTPGAAQALQQFEQATGVSVDELAGLLENEFVLYVRPALLVPEVTLVAKADDPARARATLDRLLAAVARMTGGQTETREVDGLQATAAQLGPVTLYATTYDDRVVVTTSERGIRDLRGNGPRLEDDARYRDALDSAGVEDGATVYLYVDMDEAYGLVDRLMQLSGQGVPAKVRDNLEPLRALVVSGTFRDDTASGSLFLAVD